MNASAIGWIALAIVAVVFLDILFVEVRRSVREAMRIVKRVGAYGDLPVLAQAARTGDDVERISAALEMVPSLLERGRVAVTTIRYPRGRVAGEPRRS